MVRDSGAPVKELADDNGIAKMVIAFASLPGEFATVGKLSWRRNGTRQGRLRPKKS